MNHASKHTFSPRSLTEKELSFARWLIEHSDASGEETKKYLGQLEAASVVGMCECGCASIDFAIAGAASEAGAPMNPFGDFMTKDRRFGVYVFSKRDTLAGVEIYSLSDLDLPSEFPSPNELVTVEGGQQGGTANSLRSPLT